MIEAPKGFWEHTASDDAMMRSMARRDRRASNAPPFSAYRWEWSSGEAEDMPTYATWQARHRPVLGGILRASRLTVTQPVSLEALQSNPTGANALQTRYAYSGYGGRLLSPSLMVYKTVANISPSDGLPDPSFDSSIDMKEMRRFERHGMFEPQMEDYAAIRLTFVIGRLSLGVSRNTNDIQE